MATTLLNFSTVYATHIDEADNLYVNRLQENSKEQNKCNAVCRQIPIYVNRPSFEQSTCVTYMYTAALMREKKTILILLRVII